jgi:hypothetical protein
MYEKVMDRTQNIPCNMLIFNLKLDLEGRGPVFVRMTRRLIIMNICAKYFQNPFIYKKVMDRTRLDNVDLKSP